MKNLNFKKYNNKSTLIFIMLVLITDSLLSANNYKRAKKTPPPLIITKIMYHGFTVVYENQDSIYPSYIIEFEVLNNINSIEPITETRFLGNVTIPGAGVWSYSGSDPEQNNSRYENKLNKDIWEANTKRTIILILQNPEDYYKMYNFKYTPESVTLLIRFEGGNIDLHLDLSEIGRFNILEDWKNYQRKLGLRRSEPDSEIEMRKDQALTNRLAELNRQIAVEKEKAQKEAEQKEQQRKADEAKRIGEQKQKAIDKVNSMNGLFGRNNSSSIYENGNGTGQGNGSGDGTGYDHKGNPSGNGVSSGHSWSLKDRDLKGTIPKPSYKKDNIEGLVTVNIRVDDNGRVMVAWIGKPTTISDAEILNSAMEAARNCHFTSGKGEVSGTITYNIKLK